MGIGRVLVFGLIIWFAWFIFKRLKSAAVSRQSNNKKNTNVENTVSEIVSEIKQCAVCAVHVPENEAIQIGGLFYCSKAHANKKN